MRGVFLQIVVLALCGFVTVVVDAEKTPVVVFMSAGDSTVPGTHELSFIQDRMRDARTVEIPFCQSAYSGHLKDKNGIEFAALAVITGAGYASSTSCTLQLMRYSPYEPTSVVFLGISRFSPFKGGFDPLDKPKGCGAVGTSIVKNAIGSACVTSGAFLLEPGICVEIPSENQCARPNCVRSNEGSTINKFSVDSSLADAIRAANADVEFPPIPSIVSKGLQKWWSANEAAEQQIPPTKPHIVDCVEATVNAIFLGAERDYICREYTAEMMKFPISEAVCVQAMEAFGLLKAMLDFPGVKVAIVRTASSYNMYPLRRVENDRWEQNTDYVPADEHKVFVEASARYAIETAVFVVANYFLGVKS